MTGAAHGPGRQGSWIDQLDSRGRVSQRSRQARPRSGDDPQLAAPGPTVGHRHGRLERGEQGEAPIPCLRSIHSNGTMLQSHRAHFSLMGRRANAIDFFQFR